MLQLKLFLTLKYSLQHFIKQTLYFDKFFQIFQTSNFNQKCTQIISEFKFKRDKLHHLIVLSYIYYVYKFLLILFMDGYWKGYQQTSKQQNQISIPNECLKCLDSIISMISNRSIAEIKWPQINLIQSKQLKDLVQKFKEAVTSLQKLFKEQKKQINDISLSIKQKEDGLLALLRQCWTLCKKNEYISQKASQICYSQNNKKQLVALIQGMTKNKETIKQIENNFKMKTGMQSCTAKVKEMLQQNKILRDTLYSHEYLIWQLVNYDQNQSIIEVPTINSRKNIPQKQLQIYAKIAEMRMFMRSFDQKLRQYREEKAIKWEERLGKPIDRLINQLKNRIVIHKQINKILINLQSNKYESFEADIKGCDQQTSQILRKIKIEFQASPTNVKSICNRMADKIKRCNYMGKIQSQNISRISSTSSKLEDLLQNYQTLLDLYQHFVNQINNLSFVSQNSSLKLKQRLNAYIQDLQLLQNKIKLYQQQNIPIKTEAWQNQSQKQTNLKSNQKPIQSNQSNRIQLLMSKWIKICKIIQQSHLPINGADFQTKSGYYLSRFKEMYQIIANQKEGSLYSSEHFNNTNSQKALAQRQQSQIINNQHKQCAQKKQLTLEIENYKSTIQSTQKKHEQEIKKKENNISEIILKVQSITKQKQKNFQLLNQSTAKLQRLQKEHSKKENQLEKFKVSQQQDNKKMKQLTDALSKVKSQFVQKEKGYEKSIIESKSAEGQLINEKNALNQKLQRYKAKIKKLQENINNQKEANNIKLSEMNEISKIDSKYQKQVQQNKLREAWLTQKMQSLNQKKDIQQKELISCQNSLAVLIKEQQSFKSQLSEGATASKERVDELMSLFMKNINNLQSRMNRIMNSLEALKAQRQNKKGKIQNLKILVRQLNEAKETALGDLQKERQQKQQLIQEILRIKLHLQEEKGILKAKQIQIQNQSHLINNLNKKIQAQKTENGAFIQSNQLQIDNQRQQILDLKDKISLINADKQKCIQDKQLQIDNQRQQILNLTIKAQSLQTEKQICIQDKQHQTANQKDQISHLDSKIQQLQKENQNLKQKILDMNKAQERQKLQLQKQESQVQFDKQSWVCKNQQTLTTSKSLIKEIGHINNNSVNGVALLYRYSPQNKLEWNHFVNRNNLLILIKTVTDKIIAVYTLAPLMKPNSPQYIGDEKSFIFESGLNGQNQCFYGLLQGRKANGCYGNAVSIGKSDLRFNLKEDTLQGNFGYNGTSFDSKGKKISQLLGSINKESKVKMQTYEIFEIILSKNIKESRIIKNQITQHQKHQVVREEHHQNAQINKNEQNILLQQTIDALTKKSEQKSKSIDALQKKMQQITESFQNNIKIKQQQLEKLKMQENIASQNLSKQKQNNGKILQQNKQQIKKIQKQKQTMNKRIVQNQFKIQKLQKQLETEKASIVLHIKQNNQKNVQVQKLKKQIDLLQRQNNEISLNLTKNKSLIDQLDLKYKNLQISVAQQQKKKQLDQSHSTSRETISSSKQNQVSQNLCERFHQSQPINIKKYSLLAKHYKIDPLLAAHISSLFVYQLLNEQFALKLKLIKFIEQFRRSPISKTRLIFKYDINNSTSFHKYIDDMSNLVLVVKTINNVYLATFYSGKYTKNEILTKPSLLMTLTYDNAFQLYNPITNPNAQRAFRGMVFDDFFLIFGNAELRIRANEKIIFSNFGIGNSFFNPCGKKVHSFLGQGQKREIQFESYEIFQVSFFDEEE